MTGDLRRTTLAGVPVLIAGATAAARAPAPTILWFHGLAADKEVHQADLCTFADAGLLAVGVDAVGHGERRWPDLDQRLASPGDADRVFDELVAQTAVEVPLLVDALVAQGLADARRLAVAGVSMGGCIVYRTLASEHRLQAAVALLGSPARGRPREQPFPHADVFPTALLSITAELDEVVPPAAAIALHEQLAPLYARAPHRLCHRAIPAAPHFMSPPDWQRAIAEARHWLVEFLVDQAKPNVAAP